MLNPHFCVISPAYRIISMPSVFGMSKRDPQTLQFLNDWILLYQKTGLIDRLYDHWILGKTARKRAPRWNIAHDVLGWFP
jgi:hypothetical protein